MARIRISSEALGVLSEHHWPGNVRELENTIARACALASSQILLPADIPLASAPARTSALGHGLDQVINSAPSQTPLLEWMSKQLAGRILDRADGNMKEAAMNLGVELSELKSILGTGR